jgi:flagellar biosynthesis protein FlhF
MKVKRFEGSDLGTALACVRRSLGDDALILETRQIEAGFEVLAAIEPRQDEVVPLELPRIADDYLDERRAAFGWHGVSADLTTRLTDRDLELALNKRFRFAPLRPPASGAPLMFVGEPGAGKTLSLVKLAARMVMAGVKPHLISTDGQKAGAAEQLAALTRILGLTLLVADQPATLRRAIAMRVDGAPVLIDGRGMTAGLAADDAALKDMLSASGSEPVLVVPAGLDPAETVDIAAYFADAGVRQLIATRLDVARRVGGLIEAAWRSRLVLTEAGHSADVVDGLSPMTAKMLAARLDTRSVAAGHGPKLAEKSSIAWRHS